MNQLAPLQEPNLDQKPTRKHSKPLAHKTHTPNQPQKEEATLNLAKSKAEEAKTTNHDRSRGASSRHGFGATEAAGADGAVLLPQCASSGSLFSYLLKTQLFQLFG